MIGIIRSWDAGGKDKKIQLVFYVRASVVLIILNALFPDKVGITHLIEMSSSMLLFGIIVGEILCKNNIMV